MSALRLIRHSAEFRPIEEITKVPKKQRGIYALLKDHPEAPENKRFDVVYIGMSKKGIQGRLKDHLKHKDGLWTHFSIYTVWPNIIDDEIDELEGLFLSIYRKDSAANSVNVQKRKDSLKQVRNNKMDWTD